MVFKWMISPILWPFFFKTMYHLKQRTSCQHGKLCLLVQDFSLHESWFFSYIFNFVHIFLVKLQKTMEFYLYPWIRMPNQFPFWECSVTFIHVLQSHLAPDAPLISISVTILLLFPTLGCSVWYSHLPFHWCHIIHLLVPLLDETLH